MSAKKKILALLLALLMAASAVGCASDNTADGASDTTASAADNTALEETDPVETEPEYVMWENLPAATLDGFEFKIVEYTPGKDTGATILHGDAEELTGEVINDAIYNRNRAVEERFDVKITTQGEAWGGAAAIVQKNANAGDDEYSMAMDAPSTMVTASLQNTLLNLYSVPNMNLENPWYNQKQIEGFTVRDKLYYWLGDISYSTLMFGACMIYNVDLAARYDLPYIYDLIMEGEWTIDKMYEITETIPADLNGDGKFTEGEDQFAYACSDSGNLMNFQFSSGENFIKYDKQLDAFVDTYNVERMQSIVEKMYSFFYDKNRGLDADDYTALFNDCRLLLRSAYVGSCVNHQEMEDAFTPVPYPKYDTNQAEYLSMMTGSVQVMGIPITVGNPEAVGLIVEALSEHSAGDLNDAVYEKVLSYQTMRSADASEILKVIHESLIVDYGYLNTTGGADGMKWTVGRLVVEQKSTDVASYYAKLQKTLAKFYETYLKNYDKLN
ncbi:MAG: hypothetical protein J6I42_09295 [Clostridia bacterium]|nr:hypothetical protein [Clostridia bacterium]